MSPNHPQRWISIDIMPQKCYYSSQNMSLTNLETIHIVSNEKSTRSDLQHRLIYEPLKAAGKEFQIHVTGSADFDTNVAQLIEEIPEGATVITAGGDGTAAQMANASILGGLDVLLAPAKLGNFNDQAKERQDDEDTIIDLLHGEVVMTRPIRFEVDGEYFRHAAGYGSIGWAALAAGEFSKPEVRKKIRNTPEKLKLPRSLGHVARHYFANRNDFLTPFSVNGGPLQSRSTDILAVNNKRVARVVKTEEDYALQPYFGFRADIDVSRIGPNLPFIRDALDGRAPLDRAESMHILFEEIATLAIQTDGEFTILEAQSVFAYKHPDDVVRVLHSRSSA